jgi:6-pyruvoyltetrahydropterin/6-carboxytetrahydropterin synthase
LLSRKKARALRLYRSKIIMFTLVKEFRFEAAQTLPTLGPGHKCSRMHGHSFKVEIHVTGEIDPAIGWVYDHARISRAMDPLMEQLDHSYLNEIEGLENPTIELMCMWFWEKLDPQLPGLSEIVIFETPTARCHYKGPAR